MLNLLRSTSVQLALGYGGLFIASSLLLVGILWWSTAGYLDRETDAVIIADTQAIGDRLRDYGLAGAGATINERVGQTADEHAIYLLADPTLTPIAGNMAAWPLAVGYKPGWYQVELVRNGHAYATRLLHVVLPHDFHLVVGRDVQDRVAVRALVIDSLGWAGGTALLLAILGGLLVRRSVFGRIEQINRTTTAIVQGDLSQRLPTRSSSDEFDQLARTINDMLQQLQQLIESVRNASNAIAHDLRTPLGEVRARLEEILRVRPLPDLVREDVVGAVAGIDRLIGIFNALLRLSEIDSGLRRSGFRRVGLRDLLIDLAELYGPASEEKSVVLELEADEDILVNGDPSLLAQAVGNLVDNALKYSPAHGTILVRLVRRDDGQAAISVADDGPGVTDEEKQKVTQRFYRGDASRGTPGVGLGLSLVAAVARLHGGNLELADNDPGLVATLILPTAP